MIKIETPEGPDSYHGASVSVGRKGELTVLANGIRPVIYEAGDWLNIEYQEDNA